MTFDGGVFRDKKAKYEEVCPGTLRVQLEAELLDAFEKDYNAMAAMCYTSNNPRFEDLMRVLKKIEDRRTSKWLRVSGFSLVWTRRTRF